jgi:tetratricopeptide (TPR) repeat protein
VTEPAEPWLIAVEGLGGIGKTSLADGLARGLARRLGDRFNEGRACTNLGYFFIERGYWQRAELLCCHALRIFEELGSEHGRAHTENHLGLLYTRLCRWAEARQHLEQACAIWQAMDDHHGLAYGFMNLGTLYADMEYPDESLQYSNKALDQANLVREELLLGLITINIGLAYKLKGELSTAELYSRKAEAIFERRSNSFELAHVWENLGTIYIEQQRWPEAHWHLQAALETWRRLGQKSGEIQTMLHLSRYELARGHQEEARAWLMEAERQFNQHDRTGLYHQLRIQANKIRRSLTEKTARQAATDSF